jgi:hypothetical protein
VIEGGFVVDAEDLEEATDEHPEVHTHDEAAH